MRLQLASEAVLDFNREELVALHDSIAECLGKDAFLPYVLRELQTFPNILEHIAHIQNLCKMYNPEYSLSLHEMAMLYDMLIESPSQQLSQNWATMSIRFQFWILVYIRFCIRKETQAVITRENTTETDIDTWVLKDHTKTSVVSMLKSK